MAATYTYKQLMSTTYEDWSARRFAYSDFIEAQRKSGAFTEAQVKAIYKHYDDLVLAKLEAAKKAGAVSVDMGSYYPSDWGTKPVTQSTWDKINEALSAASRNAQEAVGSIAGGSKYVVIGIVGLVLILIIGRR